MDETLLGVRSIVVPPVSIAEGIGERKSSARLDHAKVSAHMIIGEKARLTTLKSIGGGLKRDRLVP